jgi:hypothetical protein
LIFCVHDVSDAPSILGCSRRFLTGALEGAARRGLRVVTLDAALDLIAGPVAPVKSESVTPSQEFDHG